MIVSRRDIVAKSSRLLGQCDDENDYSKILSSHATTRRLRSARDCRMLVAFRLGNEFSLLGAE